MTLGYHEALSGWTATGLRPRGSGDLGAVLRRSALDNQILRLRGGTT